MYVAVFGNSIYIYIYIYIYLYISDRSNFFFPDVNCTAHSVKNELLNCRFTFNGEEQERVSNIVGPVRSC